MYMYTDLKMHTGLQPLMEKQSRADQKVEAVLGNRSTSMIKETFLIVKLQVIKMKVYTPLIAWHNRDRVSSVDFQPVAYPKGQPRLATAGDDKHVVVSDKF